jgi:hypothetical protein
MAALSAAHRGASSPFVRWLVAPALLALFDFAQEPIPPLILDPWPQGKL